MANEIEVKLVAEQQQVKSIEQLSLDGVVSSDPWMVSELKNTYFDTSSFKLRELKIGLRIRSDGERLIQTVKASGKAIGGLHERNESETELEEFKIDIEKVEDPYLKILLEEAREECGEFEPVFTTNFTRRKSVLNFADGSKVEIALDIGNIYYEDDSSPISEVELELIEGDASHLFNLSRQLITDHGFAISNASKARRGYSLCSSLPATHRKMQTIELTQGTEAEKAFEIICYSGLKHWQYYEQFLESSLAPVAILQMYRAMLYIQHVYHVFGALIPRSATSDLRANWEWMSEFIESIVDTAREKTHLSKMIDENLADEEQLASLIEENREKMDLAVSRFKKLQASSRYNLVMLGLSEWLFFKRWRPFIKERDQNRLDQPIVDFASAQLEHTLKDLKKELGSKVSLDVEGYNSKVRLLRSALDLGLFFGQLFDSKQRQKYRQPWLDLMAGTRELKYVQFVAQAFIACGIKSQEDADHWFDGRSESVLEAMDQTRKAVFKVRPYWLV